MTVAMAQSNPRLDQAKRELARRLRLARAREHVIDYACYVDPKAAQDYKAAHMRILAEKLEAVERGEIERLMVFMPPRHWKSSLISIKFSQWFIGKRFMEQRPYTVMVASYGATLAQNDLSAPSRDVVRDSELYREVFPRVKIAQNRQSSESWGLRNWDDTGDEPYPAMTAAGVGGALVGKGADLLIIDDPVKGMADAQSANVQLNQWTWWTSTARKRVNPGGGVVMVMQRWAQMDLAGQILAQAQADPTAPQWEVLVLPALAYTDAERENARRLGLPVGDDDPLGREEGEALWPEKYDEKYHLESKAIDPDTFAAVDQQMPQKPGGFLIGRDDFVMLDAPPEEHVQWVGAVDVAITEAEISKRKQPDYTVTVKLGLWTPEGNKHDARLVLADMRCKQTKDPDLFVKESILAHPELTWYFAQDNVDKMVENALQRDAELINKSLVVLPKIKGDKVVRSLPWRNRVKAGRFYVVKGSWNEFFFHVCEGFPKIWPDDPIDAVSVGTAALGMGNKEAVNYMPDIWGLTHG